jgi:hypothetical protein
MALLAEQLVDEWMNRKGFFTVQGIKEGVDEIDLLGIRPCPTIKGELEAWHVEVQVSFNPNAYISKLNRDHQIELGVRSRNSAKQRTPEFLERTVDDWIYGKFKKKRKLSMREKRWPKLNWQFKFVHGIVKYQDEIDFIKKRGIDTINFYDILKDIIETDGDMRGKAGADIIDIIEYYTEKHGNNNA